MSQLVIVTVPHRLSLAERMELEAAVKTKFGAAWMAVEVLVLDQGVQAAVVRAAHEGGQAP